MYKAALQFVAGIDTQPYRSGLEQMRSQGNKWKGEMTGMFAGALGVGAISAGIRSVIGEFARVKDVADRFGESSESIQRVGYAAEQSGTDLEGVIKSLQKSTVNAVAAANGNEELSAAFTRLNIDAAQFANMPLEQKAIALAAGLETIEDPAERIDLAIRIMGKSGGEVLPMLTQGAAELAEQMNEAATATDEAVERLARADDSIAKMGRGIKVWAAETLGGLMEIFDFLNTREMADAATAKGDAATADKLWGEFYGTDQKKKKKPAASSPDGDGSETEAAAKPQKAKAARETDARKLAEGVAAAKRTAAMEEMSSEQKLAQLAAERKGLEFAARVYRKDAVESLKIEKDLLENASQAKKAQADLDAKRAQSAEKIAAAEIALAQARELKKTSAMSDEDQAKYFRGRAQKLNRTADEAYAAGDEEKGATYRNKALGYTGMAEDAAGRVRDKKAEAEKAKADLRGEIVEKEGKKRFDALKPEEQLQEMLKRRAALERAANNETLEGLKARKDLLQLDEEIDSKRKDIAASSKEAAADRNKKDRDSNKSDPADLRQQADEMREKMQQRVYQSARVSASSLASVGGGGNIAMPGQAMLAELRQINRQLLLSRLAKNRLPTFSTSGAPRPLLNDNR